MKNYRHILFATDFSPYCKQSEERASELAQHYNARLSLVHVIVPMDCAYCDEVIMGADGHSLDVSLNKIAHRELSRLAKQLDVPKESQWLLYGSPKREILKVAKQNNVDLIVIGSHGHHGLALLLGSTATGILLNAPCDVLSVRVQ